MHWTLGCRLVIIIYSLPLQCDAFKTTIPMHNLTEFVHERQKRHGLIFQNGGSIRLVVGPVMPIDLYDKVSWRGLLFFYILHFGQFVLPSAPLYPWDKWEEIFERSLHQQIAQLDNNHEDDTRLFAYTALEKYMDQTGCDGRRCMLRLICENAQVHQHIGLMAELLNILLTPGKAHLDRDYTDAYEAGLNGVDCLQLFADCPRGQSILDALTLDAEN